MKPESTFMKTEPHITYDDEDETRALAFIHPASPAAVRKVLRAKEGFIDGRSEYCWLRLPNGDLMLGVFPRGDTYFAVEDDAAYPFKKWKVVPIK